MRALPGSYFKAVCTSPPYNLARNVDGSLRSASNHNWQAAAIRDGYGGMTDDMDYGEYVAWQRDCLTEMMRVLRPDGAIFYNQKWRIQDGLLEDRREIVEGFPVRQIIIWDRDGSHNVNTSFLLPSYEVIYVICKPSFKVSRKHVTLKDVWRIRPERGNPHPAAFPLEIPARCIRVAGGGPVLDPFLGSGTTAVAAIQEGVEWVGIEKAAKYVGMAKARIAGARQQARLA